MAYKSLLIHRCDIFRLLPAESKFEYGVEKTSPPKYSKQPIKENVPCYFTNSIKNSFVIQADPNNFITDILNVHFAKDADLQINDKIVFDGDAYKLKKPRLIRNHHYEVEVERTENL